MDKDEQERVDEQTDRFTKEIWDLKQKVNSLMIYITFKGLWDDFKEQSKEPENKCENGTKIPEGGCFGCSEGDLCE